MKPFTRVNLHCHSLLSDGALSVEALAERLAAANVEYAALTDHDTLEGLARFHEVLKRHNIGFLPGVEITTHFEAHEIHLLAYGFNLHHQELLDTLNHLRSERLARVQGPLRRMPSQHPPVPGGQPAPGVAETGQLSIQEAIALVHRAGGKAFLAHPLKYGTSAQALARLLSDLKPLGLDGIEASWPADQDAGQQTLHDLARQFELLISSGTDYHGAGAAQEVEPGIDMPTPRWKQLVAAIIAAADTLPLTDAPRSQAQEAYDKEPDSWPWPSLRPRIVLPSLVAIVLFVTAIWGMLLPSIETILIDRKRDTIRELTHTALSLLAEARREESAGELSRAAAQAKAKAYIGAIRYGQEGKDYFWIQDFKPVMIMHPYRLDLNGQDLSEFTDTRGIPIFVEFAKMVQRQKNGFVEYVWQWQDDPKLFAAKESYVTGFEPWGWIIGTGMYIDDVKKEIRSIEQNLVYILIGIVALVFVVLFINVRQSLSVEKKRRDIQASLREAEQRYRSLIEATTEGTLLVLNGRCRYGNPTLLQMTGLSAERIELLELSDLLPQGPENEALWKHIGTLSSKGGGSRSFAAIIARADGEPRECVITLNPILLAGLPGIIVLVKEAYPTPPRAGALHKLGQAAQSAAIGIFQAAAARKGVVLAMNPAARCLLTQVHMAQDEQLALADLFDQDEEYDDFIKTLRKQGAIHDHLLHKITREGRACILSLDATLVSEEREESSRVDCLLWDITDTVRREKAREASMALLRFHHQDPALLPRQIAQAARIDAVGQYREQLPALVKALVEAGAQPCNVAHLSSAVCDAATVKFIELAIAALGPPPAPFAFIAMGSQGRQEQTLLSDQDNAIIYQLEGARTDDGPSAVQAYFLALGQRVCDGLDQIGYPYCNGKVMASNPKWCLALPEWKENLSEWILKAEPKELLDLSICLDFRTVYGATELTDALRVYLYQVLKERPRFLPHLAQNVLLFKPPIRLLGKIIKSGGPREEAGQLNVKEVLMPLVGCGRLYALHYRMPHTHTLERIEALAGKGVLQPAACDAIAASYHFLMRLRFQAQLLRLQEGRPLDNCLALDSIKPMDEAMLKQAFVQIESLQKKIVYDFLGGAQWPGV
jgi:PAS domain S-box-containing protein